MSPGWFMTRTAAENEDLGESFRILPTTLLKNISIMKKCTALLSKQKGTYLYDDKIESKYIFNLNLMLTAD